MSPRRIVDWGDHTLHIHWDHKQPLDFLHKGQGWEAIWTLLLLMWVCIIQTPRTWIFFEGRSVEFFLGGLEFPVCVWGGFPVCVWGGGGGLMGPKVLLHESCGLSLEVLTGLVDHSGKSRLKPYPAKKKCYWVKLFGKHIGGVLWHHHLGHHPVFLYGPVALIIKWAGFWPFWLVHVFLFLFFCATSNSVGIGFCGKIGKKQDFEGCKLAGTVSSLITNSVLHFLVGWEADFVFILFKNQFGIPSWRIISRFKSIPARKRGGGTHSGKHMSAFGDHVTFGCRPFWCFCRPGGLNWCFKVDFDSQCCGQSVLGRPYIEKRCTTLGRLTRKIRSNSFRTNPPMGCQLIHFKEKGQQIRNSPDQAGPGVHLDRLVGVMVDFFNDEILDVWLLLMRVGTKWRFIFIKDEMWEQMLQPGIEIRSFGLGYQIKKKDWGSFAQADLNQEAFVKDEAGIYTYFNENTKIWLSFEQFPNTALYSLASTSFREYLLIEYEVNGKTCLGFIKLIQYIYIYIFIKNAIWMIKNKKYRQQLTIFWIKYDQIYHYLLCDKVFHFSFRNAGTKTSLVECMFLVFDKFLLILTSSSGKWKRQERLTWRSLISNSSSRKKPMKSDQVVTSHERFKQNNVAYCEWDTKYKGLLGKIKIMTCIFQWLKDSRKRGIEKTWWLTQEKWGHQEGWISLRDTPEYPKDYKVAYIFFIIVKELNISSEIDLSCSFTSSHSLSLNPNSYSFWYFCNSQSTTIKIIK
ncbi:hypothetical protein VP01_1566g6 [Puccinia sorghi]|uniref:Uncharacterized protein n=1 Tax=Puccinia sorghi TaxID=27349 RepID=A0A0L6VI27_9BASI|nr:hypothetical protein VP01_1566g6 [Puccinia sorghi]